MAAQVVVFAALTSTKGAVIPSTLPAGRLARDVAWEAVLRAAWVADPEVSALPLRGREVELTPLAYEHCGERLYGVIVDTGGGGNGGAITAGRPGLLLAHTGAGPRDLYLYWRAAALASRGYVVLVGDLYGDADGSGWEPSFAAARMDALRANRALLQGRIRAGLSALCALSERVDPTRCAAVGWCLGGRAVLDLARGGADVRAVVSMHGVLDTLPAELVEPPICARVLICDGARDPLNTAAARADCVSQLRGAGADCEYVSYANAVHGFTCPAQALNLADGFDYDPEADAHSWALARDFLARALAKDSDAQRSETSRHRW